MTLPASAVIVCESNRTRADLYALWLDDHEVRRALTRSQAVDAFDDAIAVVVFDHSFGDDEAESFLERVTSQAPHARVLGIRERSNPAPRSEYDRELERPVFEADLADSVETLFRRGNYHLLLRQYYRTTVAISTREWQDGDDGDGEGGDGDDERYDRLRDRAERLQAHLNQLQSRLSSEDIRAVTSEIAAVDAADTDGSTERKYRPDECAQCGQDWSEPVDGGDPVSQLGAYVWRCANCGQVDMRADPNYRRANSYRR